MLYAPAINGARVHARDWPFGVARSHEPASNAKRARAKIAARRSQRRMAGVEVDLYRKGSDGKHMKKLWGIRHVRWLYLSWMFQRYLRRRQSMGMSWFAQQIDLDFLDRVWSGDA